jgi:anaerobic magnesium-protoporphyrin IX monomethyl ester cyclase
MRICVTNPCWREDGRKGIRAGCRVPNIVIEGQLTFIPFPFMLAYATSRLHAAGFDAMILDAIGEDLTDDAYYQRVEAYRPDLIVNEMSAASYAVDLRVAAQLKTRTGAKVAVCGPHPSAIAAELLQQPAIDFVLVGEMEETLVALTGALQRGEPLDTIAGLGYRMPTGEVAVNPRRELIVDIDTLPYPHRDTLPMHNYRVAGYPNPVLYLYASRGCPYQCNYCLWPQTMYRRGVYRQRQPSQIVQEIIDAEQRHGPFRSIYFDDDTFNLGTEYLLQLADELERCRVHLPWGCNARADQFDETLMQRLAAVGMFNIRIGAESGDPEILRRVGKNLNLDSISRCIAMAHRAGVKVHVTFTIGLSGESWQSVERTAAFAKSIASDSVAFTITTPFPGTTYYDEVEEKGYLLTRDWTQFNVVSQSVMRTEHLTAEEITRAMKYVMKQVYFKPGYLWRRLRYAMSGDELLALLRKGIRLLFGR